VGLHLAALSGFIHLTGWPDRDPSLLYGAYTDSIAGRYGAAAVMAALAQRRETGEGQYIDLAQSEAGLQFLIRPCWTAPPTGGCWAGTATATRPRPPRAYRCQGEDRWCAIAVFTDGQWAAMRGAMGDPPWAADASSAPWPGGRRTRMIWTAW